jgi:hypothetical protein
MRRRRIGHWHQENESARCWVSAGPDSWRFSVD